MSKDIPRASRGWDAYNSHVDTAIARWHEAVEIAEQARQNGIAVTADQVNRRIAIWRLWRQGRFNRAELRKMTGV